VHPDDTLRLLSQIISGAALRLLDEYDDLTPFGITIHGPDATPKTIYPAVHDASFDDLLDLILMQLRANGAQGDMHGAGIATRLDSADGNGFALAVQLATILGDASLISPCSKTSQGWVLRDIEPMSNLLFPEGLWWPRDDA
jgi:hypothetical protein